MAFTKHSGITTIKSPSQKEIDEFIGKGGLVSADIKFNKDEWTKFLLRISFDDLKEIDERIKYDREQSRTSWILEAIREKLERE